MIYTDPTEFAPLFADQLSRSARPLILTHVNPDGDAIGSLLGVWHALRLMGRTSVAMAMPPIPNYASWLPGVDHIQVYQRGESLPPCDLVIMVDTATIQRTGPVAEFHGAQLSALPLVVIDHHVTNDGAGGLDLIQPRAASTCELLFHLFTAMKLPISGELATCLLLGLTTDTQSFQTSSTSGGSLRAAAGLLDHGAAHRQVIDQVYNALPVSGVQLIGRALAAIRAEDGVAWATVTRSMMQETGAPDETVDEVIQLMRRIGNARALVLFKENRDGSTKLSLRSRPPINVAAFAQRWGGGGHAQAAGATVQRHYSDAEREVIPLLKALISTQSD
jgi:bifunctional oligoribonuclease and PAP phosphatase NrnA